MLAHSGRIVDGMYIISGNSGHWRLLSGWLFCIIAGVILTLITRRVILLKYKMPALAGVIYTALFALYSMLFWLVFF